MSEKSEVLICEAKKLILQILNREWRPMRFHEILANFGYKDEKSNIDICYVLTHALHDLVKTKKIKRTVGKLGVFYKIESVPYLLPKSEPKYINKSLPKINYEKTWKNPKHNYSRNQWDQDRYQNSWMDELGLGWLQDILELFFGEEVLLVIILLSIFVFFALALSSPIK